MDVLHTYRCMLYLFIIYVQSIYNTYNTCFIGNYYRDGQTVTLQWKMQRDIIFYIKLEENLYWVFNCMIQQQIYVDQKQTTW